MNETTHHGERLARRLFEQVFNARDLAALDELIAVDYVEHALAPFGTDEPGRVHGPDHMRGVVTWLVDQYPDLRMRGRCRNRRRRSGRRPGGVRGNEHRQAERGATADRSGVPGGAESLVPGIRGQAGRALGRPRRPAHDAAARPRSGTCGRRMSPDGARASRSGRDLAPISGVVGVALFLIGSLLPGGAPRPDASSHDVVSFLVDQRSLILLGSALTLLSIPFFVFVGSVRSALA